MCEHCQTDSHYISIEGEDAPSPGVVTTSATSDDVQYVVEWQRMMVKGDDGELHQVGLMPDGERVYGPPLLGQITISIERDTDGTILVHDDKTVAYGVGDDLQEALHTWGIDILYRCAACANYDDPDSLRAMGFSDRDRLAEERTIWRKLSHWLIRMRNRVLDKIEARRGNVPES